MSKQWDEKRARVVLDRERDRIASGTGMSDRTLGRIATLAEPTSASSRDLFIDALERAGVSNRRIGSALYEVQRLSRIQIIVARMSNMILRADAHVRESPMLAYFIAAVISWKLAAGLLVLQGVALVVRSRRRARRRGDR